MPMVRAQKYSHMYIHRSPTAATPYKILKLPWRRGAVDIASGLVTEDPGSNPARVEGF
jgi:hypothetical protein